MFIGDVCQLVGGWLSEEASGAPSGDVWPDDWAWLAGSLRDPSLFPPAAGGWKDDREDNAWIRRRRIKGDSCGMSDVVMHTCKS